MYTTPSINENTRTGQKKNIKFFGLLLLLALTPILMGGICCSNDNNISFFNSSSGKISVGPQGDRVFTQIHMLDDTAGWALSDNSVLKTNDGGKSWIDITPLDWEPDSSNGTATPQDPSQQAIASISNATFYDANHAWIVATTPISQNDINAQVTAAATVITVNNDGTPVINSKAIPPDTTNILVRSTVDGGHTWVSSNPITLQNVLGTSQPDFINTHEGWLEIIKEDSKNNQTIGALYHSVDGGITWKLSINIFPQDGASIDCSYLCNGIGLFRDLPLIYTVTDNGALTGATVLPDCIPDPNTSQQSSQQCLPASTDATLGCTVPGTQDYVATATGTFSGKKSTPVYLNVKAGPRANWHILPLAIPGGAAQQSDQSLILSEPPILFSDGSAILPVEIDNVPNEESVPDNNTSTNAQSYLHLYGLAPKGTGKGYVLLDLSPTSQFTIAEIAGRHILSATDPTHVFVLGDPSSSSNTTTNNDTRNLYEFDGHQWITLTSQTDATINATNGDQQATAFTSELANLDMLSPTDGWASSGTQLYHVTISGTTATWSLVYPSENLATATASKIISPYRDAGSVISPPHNPGPCASPPSPPPTGGGNGTSNAVNHTLSFVNNTNQTIWVGESGQAASTTRPDGNWNGELAPGQTGKLTVTTPGANMENMRFWGRTGCDSTGAHCETADCGVGGLCNGNGGQPPASLAEFTYNGGNGLVYYDISFVDGYNLPMTIQSSAGPTTGNCSGQNCDLNSACPGALQIKNSGGQVVACDSNCTYAHSHSSISTNDLNEYCCLGQYVEGVCNPNNPAVWSNDLPNWPKLSKSAYPDAYSYPDDDSTSTFTCSETCDYTVTFGLSGSSMRQGGPSDPTADNVTTLDHRSSTRS